jgi:pimeloyl-ACP methyl ester carboxylesterase
MAADMSRDQGHRRGERLNDGLSVLVAGQGPPLVILPGFGPGADLSVRVPRAARVGSGLIAHGPLRLILRAAYGLAPSRPRAPGEAALIEAAKGWDITGRLGEISLPVLVAGGTRDQVVPPGLVRATAAGILGARLLMLPGRGHFSALYDPRLKPAIAAFLAAPS